VSALWLNDSKTLLLRNEWKLDIASLSEALSDLLDRDDLEVPIKLILGNTGSQPNNQTIIRAFGQLKLSEEHYREVREHWRGDLGQIIELLVPLLTILKPNASIGKLVELDTDEAVIEFLDQLYDSKIDGKTLTKSARESTGMFDFGFSVFQLFGDVIQLSQWNAALSLRGGAPLVNTSAGSTFKTHLSAAALVVRCFLAVLVARRPEVGSFKSLTDQIDALSCPNTFESDFWDVTFNQALSMAIPLFIQWQATPKEIEAVRGATSADDLADRLAAIGVDVKLDPIHLARDNRERLRLH
jgi:hypothetical protein